MSDSDQDYWERFLSATVVRQALDPIETAQKLFGRLSDKQKEIILFDEDEIFLGGGAGSGKTRGVIMAWATPAFEFQARGFKYDALAIRRTFPQLKEIIALGKANGTLGSDFVVGDRSKTRASKFTLVIPNLTQARFRQFLPCGEQFRRLRQLIDFLLRDVTAYDLELGLREEDVPPFNLQRDSGTHLGWTSFIEHQQQRHPAVVRIRGRA